MSDSRPINGSTLNSNNFFATGPDGSKLPATIVSANDGSYAAAALALSQKAKAECPVLARREAVRLWGPWGLRASDPSGVGRWIRASAQPGMVSATCRWHVPTGPERGSTDRIR